MSRFGHRVVGKQAAQKEQILRRTHGRKFGHRVIGNPLQERHEAAAAAAAEEEAAAGETKAQRVVRERAEAAKAAEESRTATREGKVLEGTTLNLDELEAALESDPTMYEDLFATELARGGGPRKGGLRLFLAHELANENRPDRLEEIQGLLG